MEQVLIPLIGTAAATLWTGAPIMLFVRFYQALCTSFGWRKFVQKAFKYLLLSLLGISMTAYIESVEANENAFDSGVLSIFTVVSVVILTWEVNGLIRHIPEWYYFFKRLSKTPEPTAKA